MAGLGIKARSSYYNFSAWRNHVLFPPHINPSILQWKRMLLPKTIPNKTQTHITAIVLSLPNHHQDYITTFTVFFQTQDSLAFSQNFGRKEFTSDPQSKSSQSPLQNWQSGIAVLPRSWPRTWGSGETWRTLHHLITLYKIYGSLQEHNSTHFPCSTQDLFAETCLQPPLASDTLHLLPLNSKACSYSRPCLASFAWHP